MPELSKNKRIRKEIKRLRGIFRDMSPGRSGILESLIKRAAFMRINLEDMEEDLDANGFTEYFQQSANVAPYERERPIAKQYATVTKNYQALMKQMSDLLKLEKPKEKDDGLDNFINGRT